jgi:hypothetical protein
MSLNTSDAPAGLSMGAFATVFQAVQGLRNRRAAFAMLGCFVAGVLVAGLCSMAGALGSALGALLMLIAVGTGINAAGTLQMDHARGVTPRSMADALVYGLLCIPKLIALGFLLLLVAIAVFIVVAVLLLICKIPFLGPLLYVAVFPLSVLVCGVTVVGLFVCMLLSLPAIWEGLGILRAVAQTLAIARTRLVETLLLLFALALLGIVVGILVFWILGAGLMPTLGLSLRILGGGGGGGGGEGFAMGPMGMLGGMGGGHALAGVIGFGILWATTASVVGQVNLLGLAIIYLRVTTGLDVGATEAALARGLEDARRRTAELGEKARAAAERGRAAAAGAAGAASAAGPDRAPSEPPPPSNPFDVPTHPGFAAPPAASYPAPDVQATSGSHGTIGGGHAPTAPAGYPPPASYPPSPPPPAPYPAAPAAPRGVQSSLPLGSAPGQPPAQSIHCPSCAAACSVDDVFCGVCGQRLR